MNNSSIESAGFTLIELLYVVALIGILASIAMPSFSQQVKRDRLVSHANKLQSVFKFARSEAAKRDTNITLAANGNQWRVNLGATELQRFSPSHPSITITGLANLVILSTGQTAGGTFAITDNDNVTTDYCLRILVSGQSSLTQTDNCV